MNPLKTGPLAGVNRNRKQPDTTMKSIVLKLLAPFLNSRLRPFLLSWKTSLAGVGLLAAAFAQAAQAAIALADGGDIDADAWASIAAQALAGWGFLTAKDADQSGEQSVADLSGNRTSKLAP